MTTIHGHDLTVSCTPTCLSQPGNIATGQGGAGGPQPGNFGTSVAVATGGGGGGNPHAGATGGVGGGGRSKGRPREHTISKRFTFSAAHRLEGLAEGHKCARVHGHNWRVQVQMRGPLDQAGMVLDYADLAPFGDWLAANLDHQWLGSGYLFRGTKAMDDLIAALLDSSLSLYETSTAGAKLASELEVCRVVPMLGFNPTAENLAKYLLEVCVDHLGLFLVRGVTVQETDSTSAGWQR